MSKRVPKRRFKGFEGEWEKECFDKIFMILSNNSLSRDNLSDTDGEVLNIHYGDVLINYGSILEGNKDIIPRIIGSETYEDNKILIDGDIVIADAAEDNTVGKCCELRNIDKYCVVAGLHTIPCRPMIDFAKYYLGYYLNSESYHNQLLPLIQGTKVSSISKSALHYTYLSYPMQAEQKKLGDFFKNLDNLITLHQQKYDKLQALKKAYLYEMFPQEGESVPKRRFPEFSGEWEKSYIENIASFSKGIGYTKNDLQFEGTPIILYGRLYTDYEFEINNVNTFADKDDFAVISKGNEVIVPASGETAEDIARASAVNIAGCILGGDLNIIIPNSEIDSSFLALAISNGYPSKDLARRAQGKTVVHVHNSDIKEVMVSYPSINEQRKIVNYVRNLDQNIKMINAKLQKLKALKQAYLAEMFV